MQEIELGNEVFSDKHHWSSSQAQFIHKKFLSFNKFQSYILNLSNRFIKAPFSLIHDTILESLKDICDFYQYEHASIWRLDDENDAITCSYRWSSSDIVNPENTWTAIRYAQVSGVLDIKSFDAPVFLSFKDTIPKHMPYSQKIKDTGLKALYAFPLISDGINIGTFILTTRSTYEAMDEIISMAGQLYCTLISSVLSRIDQDRALREQSNTYKLILDSINEGVALYKGDGTTLFLNKYILETVNNEFQTGKKVYDLILEDYEELAINRNNQFNNVLKTGKKHVFEDYWNGHWYSNRLYPILKDGQVSLVTVITEDITDHKNSEALLLEAEILKEKERDYLEIIDGSSLTSWIYDLDNNSIRFSNEWKKLFGYEDKSDSDIFTFFDSLIHPNDLFMCHRGRYDDFEQQRAKYKRELRVRTKTGNYIWVLEQGKILYNPDGSPSKIYGTMMDITDKKFAEASLRESEEMFSLAFHTNSAAMTLCDENGLFIDVNKSFLKLTGLTKQQLVGGTSLELDLYEIKRHKKHIELLKNLGDTGLVENVMYAKARKKYVLERVKLFNVNGKRRYISFSIDITKRKKAEEHILKLVEKLKKDDHNKNEFLNSLSHELRNPLATIITGATFLGMLETDPKARDVINIIDRQSKHLSRLVEDLVDITRITNNKIHLQKERVDLTALAGAVFRDYEMLFNDNSIGLSYNASDTPVFIDADPTRISQIIGNLLFNSIKFTPPGGDAVLSVYLLEDLACIAVEDNGKGLDPDFLSDLFEPFMQADKSLGRNNGGLGLGLSIVKGIAELHGGTVTAYSAGLGHGSRFTISIPACLQNEHI